MAERPDLTKLFEVWLDDARKVLVTVFFRNNPGVVDTVGGLARRLGMSRNDLERTIADHIELGLLRKRKMGRHEIIEFDARRREQLEDVITAELQARMGEAA